MSSNYEDVYKRFKCDVCGKTEYKQYKGTTYTSGGFERIDSFEPTTFSRWMLDDRYYWVCPECRSVCIEAFNQIHRERNKE